MKPTIGRIVHVVLKEDVLKGVRLHEAPAHYPFGVGAHRPAIITHVWDGDAIDVQVFVHHEDVWPGHPLTLQYTWLFEDPTHQSGSWHWPEREE